MKGFRDNTFGSIVTDPPAGIAFMNKEWDKNKGGRDQWIEWMEKIATECCRVIKPGGHALVWALPRTSHWTSTAWENGGFEVRDKIDHIFGSGFPKSLDVGKAIDKSAGVERDVIGENPRTMQDIRGGGFESDKAKEKERLPSLITSPHTDAAKQWNGWGTALKPAHEDWVLLRKPLEGTVAQNILKWGVGGINIDGCRVPTEENLAGWAYCKNGTHRDDGWGMQRGKAGEFIQPTGRFPANLIHDGSDEVLEIFPHSAGAAAPVKRGQDGKSNGIYGDFAQKGDDGASFYNDSGSAARFFYCAKASKSERNIGCENLPQKTAGERTNRVEGYVGLNSPRAGAGRTSGSQNDHPTVKPLALMRYLCRLITPPGEIILDPFAGSGSTGVAATECGFESVLIEKEYRSYVIASMRNGVCLDMSDEKTPGA